MKKYLSVLLALNAALTFAQSDSKSERKALIIGVSEYSMPGTDILHGVPHDIQSATQIALSMGIPQKNITYIKDSQATKSNIIAALKSTGESTTEGTRAFVFFSGHGTRYADDKTGNCVDGLLSYDGQAITNAEFAAAAQKLTKSSDKVITMIDACFSEGVVGSKGKTRSLEFAKFTPKFFSKSGADTCKPVNLSRGLLPEVTRLGGLQENFVQITSSRPDEVSYDDEKSGGIATQTLRDCLLGQAKDKNESGAVSVEEVQQCAQEKVDKLLQSSKVTQHITVSGNRNLIPVAFQDSTKPSAEPASKPPVQIAQNNIVANSNSNSSISSENKLPTEVKPISPPAASTVAIQPVLDIKPPTPTTPAIPIAPQSTKPPVIAAPNPELNKPAIVYTTTPSIIEPTVASLATLKDIEQQKNPKKQITVKLNKPVMKVGKDYLDISITSKSDGYLYLVLLGSDAKSFYLLFPNGEDHDNHIKAGQTVRVPKSNWGILAGGPEGTDHVLVMVADSPRSLDKLSMNELTEKSTFTYTLNDLGGRQALINYLTGSGVNGRSESFGAQLVSIKEVK
jgi:Caspase domain/Domain of unknown function (DUF4384)